MSAERFRELASEARHETTVPLSPLEREDRINRANALIHLFASALSWEMYVSDQHKSRSESTTSGFTMLEADLRDSLAELR